jgi:hypothetical protein
MIMAQTADMPPPDYQLSPYTGYGKLAYSTHFPFNVAPAAGSYTLDAMLALTQDGRAIVPIILLYVLLQRYIIRGVVGSGLKG